MWLQQYFLGEHSTFSCHVLVLFSRCFFRCQFQCRFLEDSSLQWPGMCRGEWDIQSLTLCKLSCYWWTDLSSCQAVWMDWRDCRVYLLLYVMMLIILVSTRCFLWPLTIRLLPYIRYTVYFAFVF